MNNRIKKKFVSLMQRFHVSRKYKDKLFRYIFYDKKDLLALYNAVNKTCYTDADELEITTLEDVIYLSMKNDLSFIISWTMNLYEHQSTINSNIPVRGMSYFTRIYENYIRQNGLDVYGSTRIRLPMPQFVVFYNGKKEQPDEVELKLSSLFVNNTKKQMKPALECTARMININQGHSEELLANCKRLSDYSYFVARIGYYREQGIELETAMELAVDDCIEEGILEDILSKFRNEVCSMLLTEYDEELHMRNTFAEGKAEGKTEGKAESILELLEVLGTVPKDLKAQIFEMSDADTLSRWLRTAAKAESIEDFCRKIR